MGLKCSNPKPLFILLSCDCVSQKTLPGSCFFLCHCVSFFASLFECRANPLHADLSFSCNWRHIGGHVSNFFLSLNKGEMWICEGLEHFTSRGSGVPFSLLLCCSRSHSSPRDPVDCLSVTLDFYQYKLLTICPTCAGSHIYTKSQGQILTDNILV